MQSKANEMTADEQKTKTWQQLKKAALLSHQLQASPSTNVFVCFLAVQRTEPTISAMNDSKLLFFISDT